MYELQWVQKIDMDSAQDGGIVEFSADSGKTWLNAFNSPTYVYSFYGFPPSDEIVLHTGDTAFSGTDSLWRNVWLCFYPTYLRSIDSLYVRFRFISDAVNKPHEGWMIDNFSAASTVLHPVNEVFNDDYLSVYPRLTNGPINIISKSKSSGFEIQNAMLVNELGQTVQRFKIGPGNANINIGSQPSGWYTLSVKTSVITETYQIWLKKE
jgi:hypothetical protein